MGLYLKYYYNAMGTSLLHKINNLIHVLIKIEMHKFIICTVYSCLWSDI